MSEALTHWRQQSDMNYLGAWDIPNVNGTARDLVLTIKSVAVETVENPVNKTKEDKRVIHFVENYKPMIVNTTNAKNIAAAVGSPYVENWAGHKISIYSLHGKWFGEERDALRIRTTEPVSATCEECNQEIRWQTNATVEEIVAMSRKNCDGKTLCIACMKKWKEKKKNEQ